MAVIKLFPYTLRWRKSQSTEDEMGDPMLGEYIYSDPIPCDAKQTGGTEEVFSGGKLVVYSFEIELPPNILHKFEDGDIVELTLLDGEVYEKQILSHKRYQLQIKLYI